MSFFKAELHCLGLKRRDFFLKVRQTGNHSVQVGPNLPGQVGAPLEHAAHNPNPTNWSSGCPTGTHCTPPKPHKLVKWVSHWNTLHTTQTPQTGQATSSLQRPLDLSTSGWLLLLFLYMPDGALPSNCCTLEQKVLMPMKQSSPALPIRAIVLSCYP